MRTYIYNDAYIHHDAYIWLNTYGLVRLSLKPVTSYLDIYMTGRVLVSDSIDRSVLTEARDCGTRDKGK